MRLKVISLPGGITLSSYVMFADRPSPKIRTQRNMYKLSAYNLPTHMFAASSFKAIKRSTYTKGNDVVTIVWVSGFVSCSACLIFVSFSLRSSLIGWVK